ncbi:hypothetical protein ACTXGO_00940 [Psychrobacter sp. T6-1]|uniref:hypothetical protein n=1 Tax=Psychrobacter sp. T6-1 TaxID=3457447 RepID=UPI003FD4F01C
MSNKRYMKDETGIKQMIEDISYDLRNRTIARLADDIDYELAVSAKELIEEQSTAEQRELLTAPINEVAVDVARQITKRS